MAQHVSYGLIAFDKAQREQVIIEQLPQVRYIARRIHARVPPQVLLEDLVHAGILGLLEAVNKYDPNKNVQLRHYAAFRIRGAILDSLRAVDWGTRGLRRKARRIECAISECKVRFGREPTESEIAAELGVPCALLLFAVVFWLAMRMLQASWRAPSGLTRSLALGSRDSGTCRAPSATTTAAIGTLMKKIHRQDAAAIR